MDANLDRYLITLQALLAIPAANLETALTHATDAIAHAVGADKVDAFLHDEARDSLVAVGASVQPLSALQRRLGLDVLPVSNGGRSVHVFRTGERYVCNDVASDGDELLGSREGLQIRSQIGVALDVAEQRRGMIMVASLQPGYFTPADADFVATAARWVGLVAERGELVLSIRQRAVEESRNATAEG